MFIRCSSNNLIDGRKKNVLLLQLTLVMLVMMVSGTLSAADWCTTYGGQGALTAELGETMYVPWKGWMMVSVTVEDTDWYSTDNWATKQPATSGYTFSYTWNVNGLGTLGNPTGSYSGVGNINTPEVFNVTCKVTDTQTIAQGDTGSRNDGEKTDDVYVVVVRADVGTGLGDDGTSNDPENTAPGLILGSNEDDDNANGVPDKLDTSAVTGENDLVAISISVAPTTTHLSGWKAKLLGTGGIKVYADAQKSVEIPIFDAPMMGKTAKIWLLGSESIPSTVYVEGTGAGEATLTMQVLRSVNGTDTLFTSDTAKFTVLAPNLATDSNNDGTIDGYDDAVEIGNPGKILGRNDDDDNSNGTLDMNENPVTGENDLKQVNLSWFGSGGFSFTGYKLQLGIGSGSENIRVWTTSTKTAQLTLPITYTIGTDTIPSTIWI